MNLRDILRHILPIALITVASVSCNQAQFEKAPPPVANNTPPTPPGQEPPAVCNPFGNGGNAGVQNGLVGDIYYANGTPPTYGNVGTYISNGQKVNAKLYLNDLNVPTRMFTQGFSTGSGGYLMRDNGQMLIEDFAISMQSNIRLAAGDSAGYKEFAVLSDDGSIFSLSVNGQGSIVVNNDGVTPPRMGCSNGRAFQFDANTVLPMKIDYFQGPRFHIALMLLWRDVPNANPSNDPLCGQADTNQWFSETTSAPGPWYNQLVSRGWRPLRPANYWLNGPNPCN